MNLGFGFGCFRIRIWGLLGHGIWDLDLCLTIIMKIVLIVIPFNHNIFNQDIRLLSKVSNHPVHMKDRNGSLSPSAFIPFCSFGGDFNAMFVLVFKKQSEMSRYVMKSILSITKMNLTLSNNFKKV